MEQFDGKIIITNRKDHEEGLLKPYESYVLWKRQCSLT